LGIEGEYRPKPAVMHRPQKASGIKQICGFTEQKIDATARARRTAGNQAAPLI
jgi:hypothetical protein